MVMGLNPEQVKDLLEKAKDEGEVVVVRCVRKGPASKEGGPGRGEPYDLMVAPKPPYQPKKGSRGNRTIEDDRNGVLTVFAVNRQDPKTKAWGCWRRVNMEQVVKIIHKGKEWSVIQPAAEFTAPGGRRRAFDFE